MKRLVYQFWVDLPDEPVRLSGGDWESKSQYGRYWDLSHRSCKHYARKLGYDYVCEHPDPHRHEPLLFNDCLFDKYRSIRHLRHYDQVLYVDSDVLIMPWAEDIFAHHEDSGYIGVFHQTADKAQHDDNPALGKMNSGVLLFNNKFSRYGGSLYTARARNLLRFTRDQLLDELYTRCAEGLWWENWDSKFSDMAMYSEDGRIQEENFFYTVFQLYCLPTFHLDRRWNFNYYFKHARQSRQFVHFIGGAKTAMKPYWMRYFHGKI